MEAYVTCSTTNVINLYYYENKAKYLFSNFNFSNMQSPQPWQCINHIIHVMSG